MPEQINDFYEGLQRLIKLYTDCWKNGEGKGELTVSDDKGVKEWILRGGLTERSKRVREADNG